MPCKKAEIHVFLYYNFASSNIPFLVCSLRTEKRNLQPSGRRLRIGIRSLRFKHPSQHKHKCRRREGQSKATEKRIVDKKMRSPFYPTPTPPLNGRGVGMRALRPFRGRVISYLQGGNRPAWAGGMRRREGDSSSLRAMSSRRAGSRM